eukprot:884471-Heterocapsa_arctica.AAC.1
MCCFFPAAIPSRAFELLFLQVSPPSSFRAPFPPSYLEMSSSSMGSFENRRGSMKVAKVAKKPAKAKRDIEKEAEWYVW